MCELFAISSRSKARLCYSLDEFAKHGGKRYSNRDGWGIAFYEGRDAQLFKEPCAAAQSDLAEMVANKAYASALVIAHVRLATAGKPALSNTHPFRRVRGGRAYHFAHNGSLEGFIEKHEGDVLDRSRLGETDSEMAFMDLLSRLDQAGSDTELAPLKARFDIFAEFAADMVNYGPSNFLFSDSDALFVHAHRRHYETEDGLGPARPPGLHIRHCQKASDKGEWETQGARIDDLDPQTVLIASVPLNQHGWEELPEGCALAIRSGEVVFRKDTG